MFITPKIILSTIVALACGPSTLTEANPNEREPPPEEPQKVEQTFCCTDVDPANRTGEGCVPISKEHIATCNNVLSCADTWAKKDGRVTCL